MCEENLFILLSALFQYFQSAAFAQDLAQERLFLIPQASLIVDSRCSSVISNGLECNLIHDHRILTDKSKKIISPSYYYMKGKLAL